MFFKSDTYMTTLLLNIYYHMQLDYDNLWIVVGDTGSGKSRFALQLLDHWYKVILKKPITKDMSKQMASDYKVFLNNFQTLQEYDMNIYDEGATTLDSKSSLNTISKNIVRLFNVFRAKKFFTVIVLPSFFDLNKYIRERRLRGLIWIDKRGHYNFYTKRAISYLNGWNEKRAVKSMTLVKPTFDGTFTDYDGELLEGYLIEKDKTIKSVLEAVIDGLGTEDKPKTKRLTVADVVKNQVAELIDKGKTQTEIRDILGIGTGTITKCRLMIAEEKRTEQLTTKLNVDNLR